MRSWQVFSSFDTLGQLWLHPGLRSRRSLLAPGTMLMAQVETRLPVVSLKALTLDPMTIRQMLVFVLQALHGEFTSHVQLYLATSATWRLGIAKSCECCRLDESSFYYSNQQVKTFTNSSANITVSFMLDFRLWVLWIVSYVSCRTLTPTLQVSASSLAQPLEIGVHKQRRYSSSGITDSELLLG